MIRSRQGLRLSIFRPCVVGLGAVSAFFMWGCGAPHLTFLAVTPGRTTVSLGQTVTFKLIANYNDGTTEDVTASAAWTTLNPSIATISANGVASPVAVGSATVVAIAYGTSGTASLNITEAALTAISVTSPSSPIALGLTGQLRAEGTYTDKSVQDITDQVSWSTADSGVATISSAGLAVSKGIGSTQVTASLNKVSGSGQINVSSAALISIAARSKDASVPLGESDQFAAIGTYTDGSTSDLTNSATWLSSAPGIVSINAAGVGITKAVGTASVTAALGVISGVTTFTVSPANLVSIAVNAAHSSLPVGSLEQLTAIGTYTDSSTKDISGSVTWTSSAPNVISVSSAGSVQAKSVGSGSVSASSKSVAGSTKLSVSSAALVAINISSSDDSLPVGETLQLTAIGTLTDGSSQDLTSSVNWISSSPKVLATKGGGLVAGISVGAADVTASSGNVSGVVNLNVSTPVLLSMKLAPSRATVPLGSDLQLTITGTYSDGSTQDVTQQTTWSIDNPAIAMISPGGVVTGVQVGTTMIEASLNAVQTSDTLTVQPLLNVAYFDASSGIDSTIRVANPGTTGTDLCTMIYVFDQHQQMTECCGCLISQDGLLTLSLKKDLLSNPLTGVTATSGTLMLVPAQQLSTGGCNPSSVTPAGTLVAWATHLPQSKSGTMSSAEVPFSSSPLGTTQSSSLQAQCLFIQQLGSGQGLCGCGSTAP